MAGDGGERGWEMGCDRSLYMDRYGAVAHSPYAQPI